MPKARVNPHSFFPVAYVTRGGEVVCKRCYDLGYSPLTRNDDTQEIQHPTPSHCQHCEAVLPFIVGQRVLDPNGRVAMLDRISDEGRTTLDYGNGHQSVGFYTLAQLRPYEEGKGMTYAEWHQLAEEFGYIEPEPPCEPPDEPED